ncbi:DUF1453 family protein [Luteipulveratus mongoliensis]|uniref:DUF1453 family protein n=1 Tax=Luteipulveratus mongoliensis TaxID=571913 RepID=UPI000696A95D|nr:DUF1453 family protein [Luteipulveratus mongoliensis]
MQTAFNIIAAALVLLFILNRQLKPRAIREDRPYRQMLILGAIGFYQLGSYDEAASVSTTAWVLLAVSFVVGVAFALVRGTQVHVWREGGVLMRQGNAVTIALWVVSIAVHIGIDVLIGGTGSAAEGLGTTSILAYLAAVLAVQQFVTLRRAEALADRGVTQPMVNA